MPENQAIAVVTGAGGGLGRTIAGALASENWRVIVNDIDYRRCSDICNEITHHGGQAYALTADVGNAEAVASLFSEIVNQFGVPPSLLINNAGVQTWSSLLTLSPEDWENTLNTNLTGCFLMTQKFSQLLAECKTTGSIINIGSGCNTLAFPNLVDYGASKGGIEMFTKTAALELGSIGIRVNCIAPGAIATERTAAETQDYNTRWSELTPLGRIGHPQDVANAVLLLSDDRASFITGQTLYVDGGLFSRAIWPQQY